MTAVEEQADDNVVWLDGAKADALGVPVADVLRAAEDACEEVLVLGYQKGTGHIYAAASFPAEDGGSARKALWLIERAKLWLLNGCPPQDEDSR